MPSYPIALLGDLASPENGSIAIGPFGSRMKADTYASTGVPVVRGTNISSGRSLVGDWVFVSEEFAEGIPNCIARPGDIVLPHRGAIGEVALIGPEFPRVILSSSMMKFRPDPARADGEFLYYFLKSKAGRSEILRFASQVGTPGIGQPLTSLRQFRVPVPPVSIQKRIARTLSSIDDKIELNRRMNETLEAMAQAIFRDWFVDFGPTRRKLAGITDPVEIMGGLTTDPTRAAEQADLFPAVFRDNGLPDGWNDHLVEEALTLAYGKSLTKTVRGKGEVPVYGSGGINGTHSAALVRGPGIIVGRKGTVGSLYWEDRDFFPIDTVFYVEPKRPLAFCYYLLQTLGLEKMNTDAAVPGLNRSNVYRLTAPYDEPTTEAFAALVDVLRSRIGHNEFERQTLAATRDLLLPKLMSGEIRLRDAEHAVAEAGA